MGPYKSGSGVAATLILSCHAIQTNPQNKAPKAWAAIVCGPLKVIKSNSSASAGGPPITHCCGKPSRISWQYL